MTTGINLLLEQRGLRFKRAGYFKKKLLAIFGAAGLVLSVWHAILWQQINIVIKQTEQARQSLNLVEQNLKNKNQGVVWQQKAQQTADQVARLEKQRFVLIQVFTSLHSGTPENLRLTEIAIGGDSVKLSGKADSIFGIMQLAKAFSKTKCFSATSVQKIDRHNDEYNFLLEVHYES